MGALVVPQPGATLRHRHWLSILADGGGDHVCLDFNPSLSGKVGQVIEFRRDSGERKLLNESLDGYIGDLEL